MLFRVARLTLIAAAGLLVSVASAKDSVNVSSKNVVLQTCAITDMVVNEADTVFTADGLFYSQPVVVTYEDPPASGVLGVYAETTRWIVSRTVSITGSPQTVILNGLHPDSSDVTVTATFSADPLCTLTVEPLFVTLTQSSRRAGPPVDAGPGSRGDGYELNYAPALAEAGTKLYYSVPRDGSVSLVVYSVSGRRVRTLVHGYTPVGTHEVLWNGYDNRGIEVPSGMYFAVLRAPGVKKSRGIVLLR